MAISPELVLVDPALRGRVLGTYLLPRDLVQQRPVAPTRPEATRIASGSAAIARPGRAQLALAAFFGGVAMLVATHPPSFPLLGGVPPQVAPADGASVGTFEPTPVSAALSAPPAVKLLAWKPVAGATGYDVAIYRAGAQVLQKRTTSPRLKIPLRSPADPAGGLAPGGYDWYVWPIHAGRRGPAAVVRSSLVLSVG